MASFDEIKNDASAKAEEVADRAKAFVDENKDRIADAVKSDRVEEVSDKILDGIAGAVKKVTGGKFDDKIDETRDNVDKHVGNE
jgi:hypothetical protein